MLNLRTNLNYLRQVEAVFPYVFWGDDWQTLQAHEIADRMRDEIAAHVRLRQRNSPCYNYPHHVGAVNVYNQWINHHAPDVATCCG